MVASVGVMMFHVYCVQVLILRMSFEMPLPVLMRKVLGKFMKIGMSLCIYTFCVFCDFLCSHNSLVL